MNYEREKEAINSFGWNENTWLATLKGGKKSRA
jgi:hypothetical protein